MIVLSVNNISKSFLVEPILKNISFSVNEFQKIGIVGPNGVGKSTLFKIITSEIEKDSGDIFWKKDTTYGYLKQNIYLKSQNTIFEEVLEIFKNTIKLEKELRVLENKISTNYESNNFDELMDEYSKKSEYFSSINGFSYKSEAIGVLKGLGFSEEEFNKKVNLLSGGEQTRLNLSKLLLTKPDVLLLDEPTNHLDTTAVQWLESYLKQYKGTVLIISHDRYFLDKTIDTIIELKNKSIDIYNGNYTNYLKKRELKNKIEEKKYQDNQNEIKKQHEVIEKLKSFGREKHVKRARSREKLLEKIEIIEKPNNTTLKSKIIFSPEVTSGYEVLKANQLSKNFGEKTIFKNLSFEIFRGDKIALIGPNGIGKTTLFKSILASNDNIIFGTNVNPEYFDQTRSDLNPKNTIIDEVWNTYPLLNQTTIRNYLASFLFAGEDVFKTIETLSGGEQSRISLLKLMLSKSNFLFLDEPTNHLDIESKEVLEENLKNYDGTILFISHDRYFINSIANKIFELSEDGLKIFLGNYDDYLYKLQVDKEKLEEANLNKQEIITKTKQKQDYKKEKNKNNEIKKIKNAISEIELQIHNVEEYIKSLDALMCLEENYSNPSKMIEINDNKQKSELELDKLIQTWEEHIQNLDKY